MFNNYPVLSRIALLLLDSVLTVLSYVVAMHLRTYTGLSAELEWRYYVNLLLIIMIIWGGLLEYQKAYAGKAYKTGIYLSNFSSLRKELVIVLRLVLFGSLIVYLVSHFINLFIPWEVPKSLLLIFGIVNMVMLSTEKAIVSLYLEYEKNKKKNIKRVVVLGTGSVAKQFIDSIDTELVTVLGLIGNRPGDKGKEIFGYKILGCNSELADIVHSHYIDELVIALPAKYFGDLEGILNRCDMEGIPVRIVSPFFKNLISKSRVEIIRGLPNIMFVPVERNDLEVAIKRLLDVVVSFASLVLMAPLFVIIAILIKRESSGPVFYKWRILGLNKKPLVSYKFRTMVENADAMKKDLMLSNEMKGAAFKMSNDPRITRTGAWLRKFSLDELPQLWSVLKGDLSLVGPRPPLQTEIELYKGWHRRKLSVKPGITCLWQIRGRNEISDFDEWMQLDLKYIDEWSLWLDIKILLGTIPAVIKGTGR